MRASPRGARSSDRTQLENVLAVGRSYQPPPESSASSTLDQSPAAAGLGAFATASSPGTSGESLEEPGPRGSAEAPSTLGDEGSLGGGDATGIRDGATGAGRE